MSSAPFRSVLLASITALGVVMAISGCTTASSPTAPSSASATAPAPSATVAAPAPTPTPTADPALSLGAHLVTQEGLAIALASNVLQSQLQLVQSSFNGANSGCKKLSGGGSVTVTGFSRKGAVSNFTDHIYYDTACAQPYIVQPATVTQKGDTTSATATATYTKVDGTPLATLTTDAHADLAGSGISLEGLGTFASADGTAKATLGLACQSNSETVLKCQGGVAQDFAALAQSVGSITPLTLRIGTDVTDKIAFSGTSNSTSTGALGALSVTSPDKTHLAIAGATAATSKTTTTGTAGGFVLFPPTPTGWTIVDPARDVTFSISVISNSTRQLSGSVTQTSSKKSLVTFAVDRSGTGSITFDGQPASSISSWVLAN